MKRILPALEEGHGSFETTRWSLILRSSEAEVPTEKTLRALSELCHIYWKPVYCFILGRGRNPEDAQDLTQDFFMMVLDSQFLQKARSERGRFRSMIWTSLENFLRSDRRHAHAQKRGGDWLKIPLQDWNEEALSTIHNLEPLTIPGPDSKLFDLRWAATLSETASKRLREECAQKGRERVFDELCTFLTQDAGEGGYQSSAEVLGLKPEAVRVLVSRLRARHRALLREEVSGTVANTEDIQDELRYLFSLLVFREESQT